MVPEAFAPLKWARCYDFYCVTNGPERLPLFFVRLDVEQYVGPSSLLEYSTVITAYITFIDPPFLIIYIIQDEIN